MNGPNRNVVLHDPRKGFSWDALPIGAAARRGVCRWPCEERTGVEFGKVEQKLRPGHRYYGIKQVPVPLDTNTAIESMQVEVLINKTY